MTPVPRPSAPSIVVVLAGILALAACVGPDADPALDTPAAPVAGSSTRTAAATAVATATPTPTAETTRPRPAPTPTAAPSRPSASAAPDWQRRLAAGFEHLVARSGAGEVGVRIGVVGRDDALTVGSWTSGPAWSTIKVPLSLAARDAAGRAAADELVRRAIRTSDNAAADALWTLLGTGARAAGAVDRRLAAEGDTRTRTQWQQVRPPFSPFGQTQWSLDAQVSFAAGLACDRSPAAAFLKAEMGSVTASQRWGLGRIAGAAFKGGWGPDPQGRYLVRQFGILPRGADLVVVAVAVVPRDGTFARGTAALDEIATWLRSSLPALPSAGRRC